MDNTEEILKGIEIVASPKKGDCLAWSDDGELAIAAGDYVHILVLNALRNNLPWAQTDLRQIPKRDISEERSTTENNSPWQHIYFAANVFERNEWPDQELQSFDDFSIGKEQALVEVIAMAWSSPGLADGGRCALAILTSNYLLSIWGPTLEPSNYKNWSRRWIANRQSDGKNWGVLAMAWSPSLDSDLLASDESPKHPSVLPLYQTHYLALITEYGDTIFYQVSYDYEKSGFFHNTKICAMDGSLDLQVRSRDGVLYSQIPTEELYKFAHQPQSSAFHSIVWSGWENKLNGNEAVANLLWKFYNTYKILRVTARLTDSTNIEIATNPLIQKSDMERQECHGKGSSQPCTSTPDISRHFTKSKLQPLRASAKTWDQPITLCPFRSSNESAVDLLFIASHLGRINWQENNRLLQDCSTNITLDGAGELIPASRPSELCRRVAIRTQQFQTQHEYDDEVEVRVWGLCSWKSYVAICITLHPSNLVQYLIPSNSKLHIIFTNGSFETKKALPPGTDMSGYLDEMFPWELLSDTTSSYEANCLLNWPLEDPGKYANSAPIRLNCQLLLASLFASILRLAPGESYENHVENILQAMATSNYFPDFKSLEFHLKGNRLPQPDGPISEASILERINAFVKERSRREISAPNQPRYIEYCTIEGCAKPVYWYSESDAGCEDEHMQVRCFQTSLAFLNPYLVKRCDTCRRPYMNQFKLDTFYAEAEQAGMITRDQRLRPLLEGEHDEVRRMLLRMVLCIYCGGKFIRQP